MNQHAGEMVPGRVLVKQLIVERVRQPGERMPVPLLGGREGPGDGVPVDAFVNVSVSGDITVVIVVNEGVAVDRIVKRQCRYHQQQTQYDVALFGGREKAWRLRGHGCKDLTTEDTEDTEAFSVTHHLDHVTNVTYCFLYLL